MLSRLSVARRRARLADVGGPGVTESEWAAILTEFAHRCARCGTDETLTMDHIVPIHAGGEHGPTNVQPLCKRCNSWKRVRTIAYAPDGTGIEVTDMRALAQAIVAGDAPLDLLKPNQIELDRLARSLRGAMAVPGVRAVNDRTTTTRA